MGTSSSRSSRDAAATEGHEDAEAKALAEAALARVKKGEAFEKVAKEKSEDSSAANGGSLGCFGRGQMVPEFESVAFTLKAGTMSDVVKSPFGYHIIKVDTTLPESTLPLEQARKRIEAQLQESKARELAAQKAEALALALKGNQTLEQIATAQGLTVKKSEPLQLGRGAGVLTSPVLLSRAFELKAKETAKDGFPAGAGAAFIRLDEILPPKTPELAEVKEEVRKDLVKFRAREKAREAAQALAADAGRTDLAKAAARAKASRVETKGLVGRGQAFTEIPQSSLFENQVFDLTPGKLSAPLDTTSGVAIVRVLEKKSSDEGGPGTAAGRGSPVPDGREEGPTFLELPPDPDRSLPDHPKRGSAGQHSLDSRDPEEVALDYRAAGVDIVAADEAKDRIKRLLSTRKSASVLSEIGSFGGVFQPDFSGMEEPVLVSSTDGVGTKIRFARDCGVHDTIGYDLVAHCVNDILVQGAKPLFFLDYIALGRMDASRVESIVSGIARACEEFECPLIGGETAEMPGTYAEDDYDLAGFIVGAMDKKNILPRKDVAAGDVLIGLPSLGLHTNGYSLARKVLIEGLGLKVGDRPARLPGTVGEALLAPHRSYLKALWPEIEQRRIKALVHITGGGFEGNIPRVLPEGIGARISTAAWAASSHLPDLSPRAVRWPGTRCSGPSTWALG